MVGVFCTHACKIRRSRYGNHMVKNYRGSYLWFHGCKRFNLEWGFDEAQWFFRQKVDFEILFSSQLGGGFKCF